MLVFYPFSNSGKRSGHSKYCGAPNPVSIAGIVAAYNECEDWLEAMLEYLDGNFEYLDNFIKNNLPKVKFRISESTFSAWLDLSAYGKAEEEMYREVASAGLYLEYAEDFVGNGEDMRGWIWRSPELSLRNPVIF